MGAMHEHAVESRVPSAGVELAVRELPALDPAAPTVVAVHGYPDTQDMWEPVVRRLHDEHALAVITYDVRGAGASSAPDCRAGYRTERLVDDLVAVLDATRPTGAVHLLGHDWGSVQLWDAVCAEADDPRFRGRIASFTSISGPSLDHVARFGRTHDLRTRLAQVRRSWYVAAFHVPVLPELVYRRLARPVRRWIARGQRLDGEGHWADTFGPDAARGVELYRANVVRRLRAPGPGRTWVPVLTIVAALDAFLTTALFDDVASYAPNGRRVDVAAGHWLPRQEPDLVADLVAGWVGDTQPA